MAMIVQKYGGSSVSSPEKILSIAKRIQRLRENGHKVIVVVSAMGKTTNELASLAASISPAPNRREFDMLLSTGERISMALLAMALNDLGCSAISFTGSQAGIFTDYSHNNARLIDVKPVRIVEELSRNNVVVLAGFQGVNPKTREITTLGRGGSDLTAIGMAAYFKANRCEMLKDVDGVFTSDPNLIRSARRIERLDYKALLNMTFWGAKMLHIRAVELAMHLKVPIFLGLAHGEGVGTLVTEEANMFEKGQVLSVNSHQTVRTLDVEAGSINEALTHFHDFLRDKQLPWPQLLDSQEINNGYWQFLITAPQETFHALQNLAAESPRIKLNSEEYSTVTATCQGLVTSGLPEDLTTSLGRNGIHPRKLIFGEQSLTALVNPSERESAIKLFHDLV
jgi:aspartate kinase